MPWIYSRDGMMLSNTFAQLQVSKMSSLTFISSNERYTQKVAQEFARTLRGDEKICLVGPLGSGKTCFVRGFAQARGVHSADVMSPTFTLVREYDAQNKKLYHI